MSKVCVWGGGVKKDVWGEREERLVWVKVDVRTLGIGLLCDAHAGKRDQTYVLW